MSRPGTFERVYAALKARLREGSFHPGERLEPAALADQLNASVTPVRDALHRLTGERMVEAPRHEGFRALLLSESMLRHLYAWHLDMLLLATTKHNLDALNEERLNETSAEGHSPERMFAELAAHVGNPEFATVFNNLDDRLRPYHRLEGEFIDAVDEESERIARAIKMRDARALRKSLVLYHRRRQRIVPELIERILADRQ